MFEVQKLPPKEGLANRAARFVLQSVDKMLYPDSDRVVGGGEFVVGAFAHRPEITQREMNDIAREYDVRRYGRFGVGEVIGGNNLPEIYKGLAEGTIHITESTPMNGPAGFSITD